MEIQGYRVWRYRAIEFGDWRAIEFQCPEIWCELRKGCDPRAARQPGVTRGLGRLPLKGLIRSLKGLIRPLKGLIRPFRRAL